MEKMRLAFVAATAALLAGCGTVLELDQLKNAEPEDSAFNKSLTGQHLDLAEFERKELGWIDARNHAKKGLCACSVLPVFW